MKSNAQYQAAYRTRQSEKLARAIYGLTAIIAELGDSDKPKAVRIREIAMAALAPIA